MDSVREGYGKCKGVIHECKGGFLVLYGRSTVLIQNCTGDTPITYSAICYYYIKVLGTGLPLHLAMSISLRTPYQISSPAETWKGVCMKKHVHLTHSNKIA